MRQCLVILVGWILVLDPVRAAVVTWTGAGDGRGWGVAANWEGRRLPGLADDVVIPLAFAQVEHTSGTTVIRSLTAPGGFRLRGGTLRLTAGESRVGGVFELAEGARIEGEGPTVMLRVDGASVEWQGEVRATEGAVMDLVAVARLRGGGLEWFADGVGSLIDAPGVTNITLTTSAGFPIWARNEARVVLSGLEAIRGPLQVDARDFSEVDLSGLRGRWTSIGFQQRAVLTALDGGRIRMPGVTGLEEAYVTVDSAEGLETAGWTALVSSRLTVLGAELDFRSMVDVAETDLRLSDGAVVRLPRVREVRGGSPYWWVDGPGTLMDAAAITNIVLDTSASFPIQARNGARVVLTGLTMLRGAVMPDAREEAVIDLGGVQGPWSSASSSQRGGLTALEGGRVVIPGVTAFEEIHIQLDSAEGLPTAGWTSLTDCRLFVDRAEPDFRSLTNVNGTDLRLGEGAVVRLPGVVHIRADSPYWLVDGPGTVLDASALTNVALRTSANFPVQARNDGRVLLTGLRTVRGTLRADARDGGVVDASGLRGRWTSAGASQRGAVTALEGGRVRLEGVTELDGIDLMLDAVDGVETSGWTALTESQLVLTGAEWNLGALTNLNGTDVRLADGAMLRLPRLERLAGESPYWLADGPGVLLDARFVKEITLARGASFPIQARNQARIDLSGVAVLSGAIQADARGGAVIDFSGAQGDWRLGISSGSPSILVASDGWVRMPGVTGFESGYVTVDGTGRVDTEQWERLVDSLVTVDGVDAVLELGRLRDQTDTTFRVQNGGRILYGARPRLVSGPVGRRVGLGDTLVLTVDAEGEGPLRYQWYRNGQPLPGEVNASLRLESVGVKDAGSYVVFVGNPAGLIASDPAVVTLDLDPLPFDDAFARRGWVTGIRGLGIGSTTGATREPGEPRHAGKPGGGSVWLTWRSPATGVVTFRTTGSDFDTVLAVYRGTTLASLEGSRVASDEDGGGFLTSEVRFNAQAGVEYAIAVDGYAGARGSVVLEWDVIEVSAAAPMLPEILRQPEDVVAVIGAPATLSVDAQAGNASYQWLRNGVPLAGETGAALRIAAVRPEDAAGYQVLVRTSSGGTWLSDLARLEAVDRPENATGYSADKVEDLFGPDEFGDGGAALLGISGSGAGIGIGLPGGRWTDNRDSTRSPGDPVVCDVETTATRWFRLQLKVPSIPAFTLHTEGSEIPAFLAVFTNVAALKLVGCDAAVPLQKPAARIVFPARAGVDYLVLVDGVGGAQGRIQLNWALEETETPARRPELRFEGGRLVIQMFPLPGTYDWNVGGSLLGLRPLFRTNLSSGSFRYADPDPASAPGRFYWLKPVRP